MLEAVCDVSFTSLVSSFRFSVVVCFTGFMLPTNFD